MQPHLSDNVYNTAMQRWLILAVVGILLCACERELPPERAAQAAQVPPVEHPWDLDNWVVPYANMQAAASAGQTGETVEIPPTRGPAFSSEDTLDRTLLAGSWRMVLSFKNGSFNRLEPSIVVRLTLNENGSMEFLNFANGELVRVMSGTWDKPAPGKLTLTVTGQQPMQNQAEMYGEDFLYLWVPTDSSGSWLVREQQGFTPQVMYNRFDTTRGELLLSPVQRSWEGTVTGKDEQLDCVGFYYDGILTCEWENQELGSMGFGAFIVEPDWSAFHGVSWVADPEAAPFGQAWDGTAIR